MSWDRKIIEVFPIGETTDTLEILGRLGLPMTGTARTKVNRALSMMIKYGMVERTPPERGHPFGRWKRIG